VKIINMQYCGTSSLLQNSRKVTEMGRNPGMDFVMNEG